MTMADHHYPARDDNDRITIPWAAEPSVVVLMVVIVVTSRDALGPPP
jgi:hypothetical protein